MDAVKGNTVQIFGNEKTIDDGKEHAHNHEHDDGHINEAKTLTEKENNGFKDATIVDSFIDQIIHDITKTKKKTARR